MKQKKNIILYVLCPENKKITEKEYKSVGIEDVQGELRETRILPGRIDVHLGYGVYGDKVAFISSKKENFSFILESKDLAKTLKNQFDYFWKLSKKL